MRTEALELELRAWGDDVHPLGERALDFANDVGVKAELENRPGPCFLGELGVDDLIRPVAEAQFSVCV